jgi:L-fuculose-phosphate aldolase
MGVYEDFAEQRGEVAYYMRRCYERGLTTCGGGNISMRVGGEYVLLTPAGVDKMTLTADSIGMFTMAGENMTPHIRATIETEMHIAIYHARPDIAAVVHTHSVYATAFSCMSVDIETGLTPEAIMSMGDIARAPYRPAGTPELAEVTAVALAKANVALMSNHGVATVGPTMYKAYDRLELTENAAKMTWLTKMMNDCRPLSPEQQQLVRDLRKLG